MALVAIRHDADRLRPGNRQHRIERRDAAFVIGGIIFTVEIDPSRPPWGRGMSFLLIRGVRHG